MLQSTNKATIIRNFSRYAHLYDRYANIQRLAAERLIGQLPSKGVESIFEIGCGTGNYTALLKERFKSAPLKALDISKAMIKLAQQKLGKEEIEFIVADAEEININGCYSLITSNSAFQWFENIKKAIEKYRGMLTEKGLLLFSIFGPLTFWELKRALRKALNVNISLSVCNFLEKEELGLILKRYFRHVNVKEAIIKEQYRSLRELFNKIKYTGTRGSGLNGNFLWKRECLKRIEEIYRTEFGQIQASYQIFFCKAMK